MKKTLISLVISASSMLGLEGCSSPPQTQIPAENNASRQIPQSFRTPEKLYESEETLRRGSRSIYLILDAVLSQRVKNPEDRTRLNRAYEQICGLRDIDQNLQALMDLCIKYDSNFLEQEREQIDTSWIYLFTGKDMSHILYPNSLRI